MGVQVITEFVDDGVEVGSEISVGVEVGGGGTAGGFFVERGKEGEGVRAGGGGGRFHMFIYKC